MPGPGTRPDNLFAAGKGFAIAAQRLMRPDVYDGAVHAAILHLICNGFELVLKAAICSTGATETQLRKVGHDLDRALNRARQAGLRLSDPSIEHIVAVLNPPHRDSAYRYVPDVELLAAPNLGTALLALSHVVDAVEDQFVIWADD